MRNERMAYTCHRSVKIKGNCKEYKHCQNLKNLCNIPIQMDKLSSADNSCKPDSTSGPGSEYVCVNMIQQREVAKKQVNIRRG